MIEILQKIPFFAPLSEADLAAIAKNVQMEYYPANYTIFNQGDLGDRMYIIKRGRVAVERHGSAIAELSDNQFFGEMALFSSDPRNATLRTLSEIELLVLTHEDFQHLLETNPEIAQTVSYEVVKRAKEND